MILAVPDGQQSIGAVQMPAADVVENRAAQAIAAGLAASITQVGQCVRRRLPSPSSEIPYLTTGGVRQVDFDRDRGFPFVARSSSSRSSVRGRTRPAATSSKP